MGGKGSSETPTGETTGPRSAPDVFFYVFRSDPFLLFEDTVREGRENRDERESREACRTFVRRKVTRKFRKRALCEACVAQGN